MGPGAYRGAPRHIPKGVILQHNFETGGFNRQLGKMWSAWDYWLSTPARAQLFERVLRERRGDGARVSAELQVGCSRETATAQVVPAPSLLHRNKAMRRLGVSAAMHSWYFGTYPSLMTRAAGELSFDPALRMRMSSSLTLARRAGAGMPEGGAGVAVVLRRLLAIPHGAYLRLLWPDARRTRVARST